MVGARGLLMPQFAFPKFLKMENTPRTIVLFAVLGVVFLVVVLLHLYWGETSGLPSMGPYYYSTDGGKTFFASGQIHIPPFKHNGKTAVAAVVYVDTHGKPFVGYVFTYGHTGHDLLLGLPKVNGQTINNIAMRRQASQDCFVRKPGSRKWVPWNSPEGRKIENVINPITGKPLMPYNGS